MARKTKSSEKLSYKAVFKIAVGFFVFFIFLFFVPAIWAWVSSSGRILEIGQVPKEDLIVFGSGLNRDGTPSPFLAGRLDRTVDLYRAGKAKKILLSGSSDSYYSEPKAMRKYLIDRGVSDAVMLLDEYGVDSYDTLIRARDIYHLKQVTLVTQSYHLPRALTIASALGLEAVGFADDSVRTYSGSWRKAVIRELGADWKMVFDVFSGRPPKYKE